MGEPVQLVQLADKIVGAEPRFDATGQRVAVTLYRMLSEGTPVAPGGLAAALGVSEDAVRSTLDGCSVFYDDQGAVVGFRGPHGRGDAASPVDR